MEGLEISEVKFSQAIALTRCDAEYFRPQPIALEKRLTTRSHTTLGASGRFVAGPFGSEFHVENYDEESSFRYVRGKDVKSFFVETNDNVYIPESDFQRLSEYAIKDRDVIVSVVGTLGNACIATSKDLPAIFSCKSTVIREPEVNPFCLVAFLNSGPGKSLLLRSARGTIQLGLNLTDLRQFPLPKFSTRFQDGLEKTIKLAEKSLIASEDSLASADQTLLKTLGLEGWYPPHPLTYTRRTSEVFAERRIDSPYHSPRVRQLLELLASDNLRVGDVALPRHEEFVHGVRGEFDYIEIGDLQSDGTAESNRLPQLEAPSRATWHVRSGDVLTSTVRPIRRLSAIITPEQDSIVCSSGFVVLAPQAVSSELLLTYLRLPQVCELMDLHTSASMYPAISEGDLLNLPIRRVPSDVERKIVSAVRSSHNARRVARNLLDRAKRAVEIAIEQDETSALRYLSESVG